MPHAARRVAGGVTYVTTALNDEAFDPDLAHWEHAIPAALGGS